MQNNSDDSHVNVGSEEDISILELAELICKIVGFEGDIKHDLSKPDGTPRKLMSAAMLNGLGWKASTSLATGIRDTYRTFLRV